MGLFDIFLSPQKQIEKENKLLLKPDRVVAVVTSYCDWDESESITLSDGNSDIRTFKMEEASFKFCVDNEIIEYTIQPREGSNDFHVGEQC